MTPQAQTVTDIGIEVGSGDRLLTHPKAKYCIIVR
jgi:hypothetical protein